MSKSNINLNQGAFDSMLALSEDGRSYRVRQACDQVKTTSDSIISVWRPWDDVTIKTILIPLGDYHIRVHKIASDRTLIAAEGGFSTARDEEDPLLIKLERECAVAALYPWNCTGIIDLGGTREAELLEPEVNTNLIYPRTIMPMLKGVISKGETVLVCAVLGTIDTNHFKKLWEAPPTVSIRDKIKIEYMGETRYIDYE